MFQLSLLSVEAWNIKEKIYFYLEGNFAPPRVTKCYFHLVPRSEHFQKDPTVQNKSNCNNSSWTWKLCGLIVVINTKWAPACKSRKKCSFELLQSKNRLPHNTRVLSTDRPFVLVLPQFLSLSSFACSIPPPSAGFFFICRLWFPQLMCLFHCNEESRENGASSCFGLLIEP